MHTGSYIFMNPQHFHEIQFMFFKNVSVANREKNNLFELDQFQLIQIVLFKYAMLVVFIYSER